MAKVPCALALILTILPSLTAKAGAPVAELVNSGQVDYGAVVTDFGIFVTRTDGKWGENARSTLVHIDPDTGEQSAAPFASADYEDSDPGFDPATKRLCFVSTRPISEGRDENMPGDIWCVGRTAETWSEPFRLPEPVNSPAREYSPSFDASGTMYFASDRPGGFGQGDIYVGVRSDSDTWTVDNLGPNINSPDGEWNVGVRADGAAMILEASSRATNRSAPGDLYYSEMIDGRWSKAVALSVLNTDESDLMARWISDREIIFASARGGNGDVDHYISAEDKWMPINQTLAVISRSRGEVVLLDPPHLSEIRRISVGTGPHEVSASNDGRFAVVPLLGVFPKPHERPVDRRPPFLNRPSDGVSVIDLAAGIKKTHPLSDCERPHGAAVDAQARRIWITCENEGTIIELDSEELNIVRRIDVDKGVHKVAYHQGNGVLFATSTEAGAFYRINTLSDEVEKVTTGAGAEGFAISKNGETAWVANGEDRTLCKVNVQSLTVQFCNPVDGVFPIAIGIVEVLGEVWVSRLGSSDIGVFSIDSGAFLERIALPTGALDLEVDDENRFVYASLPRHNRIIAIDQSTRRIVASYDDAMEADDIDLIIGRSSQ